MKKLLAILVFYVALVGIPSAGLAQGARISDFERDKSGGKTVSLTECKLLMNRLIGTYEGIGWVNALNEREGRKQIFCPPSDFVISEQNPCNAGAIHTGHSRDACPNLHTTADRGRNCFATPFPLLLLATGGSHLENPGLYGAPRSWAV